MSILDDILTIANAQHGAIGYEQLRALKISDAKIRTLVLRGQLQRPMTGVYSVGGSPLTWKRRVMEAALAGGPLALAGHRAAAALWALDRYRQNHVELVTPRWTRRTPCGLIVHESGVLPTRDRSIVDGIPVTSPTRTLVDMGRYLGAHRLGAMVDDAVRRDLTSFEEVHQRIAELARSGRSGIVTAREAMRDRPGGSVAPDSTFERDVQQLLLRADLPAPVLQHRVICNELEFALDLSWPEHLAALECDGFRFHREPEQLEWDDRRQNRLGLRGWMIQHATWKRLRRDPDGIVSDVREALEARSHLPGGA